MSKKKHKPMNKKKKKRSSSSRSRKNVDGNAIDQYTSLTDRPDWLPDDWEIELKARTTSCRTDRYFVCPVSGKKLRSKLEVFNHLNNGVDGSLEIEPPPSPSPPPPLPPRRAKNLHPKNLQHKNGQHKNRQPKGRSTKSCRKLRDVPVIEHLAQVEDTPADLPEGWIKEIRPRRTGDKTDAYYIDPVHGYGFRSKKDVFRYIENKDLSRVVFILKRPPLDTLLMIDDSLPIVEFLKCTRKRSASKRRISDGNELISNSITPQRAAVLSLRYASTKFEEGSSETACSTTMVMEHSEQCTEPLLIEHHSNSESDDLLNQCTEKQTTDLEECHEQTTSSHLEDSNLEINIEECHEQTTNSNFQEPEKKSHLKSPVKLQDNKKPHPDKDNLEEEKPGHSKKDRRLQKRKAEKLDAEPAQTSKGSAGATDDLIFNTDVGKRYAKLKSKQIEKKLKATMPTELNERRLSCLNHSVEAKTPRKVHNTEPNVSDKDVHINEENHKNLECVKPTMEFVSEGQHFDLVEKFSSIKLVEESETSQNAHTDKLNSSDTTGVKKNDGTQKKLKTIKLSEESKSLEKQHMNMFGRLNSINQIVVAETTHRVNITEPNDWDKRKVQKNDDTLKESENINFSVETASDGQLQVDSFANVPIFIYSWSDPCIEFAFKTLTNEDEHENEEIQEDIKNIEPIVEKQEQHLDCVPKSYEYCWSDPCIEFAFRTLTSDFSSLEDFLSQNHTSSQYSNKSASMPIPSASRVNTHGSENEKVTVVR